MSEDLDFIIEDRLQRLEAWSNTGRLSGLTAAEVKRSADLHAAAVLVPVCGGAVQKLGTGGFEPDGFMLQSGTFRFAARHDLKRAVVTGWLPEGQANTVRLTVSCNGRWFSRPFPAGTAFSLELPLEVAADAEAEFRIALSSSYQPAAVQAGSSDTRHLGCIIQRVEFS